MAAINPAMSAAFGLVSGALAQVTGGFAGGSNSGMVVTSGSASTGTSAASSSGTADYHMDKTEWMNRIETSHIDRSLMNRLVMNYLVTEGFKEAADKFGSETGICYPYDLESLDERIKIREALEVGDIQKAIDSINSLHPELIDTNRHLAFHLRQQQLIELIREKRLEDALMFAQNHLCEYGENNEEIQEELERTMALLAFENPTDSPFCDLLAPVQRQRLSGEVNAAILEFENLESNAKLSILIKMLLWSQDLLDKRAVNYPKMIDLANARVEDVNMMSSQHMN